MSSGVVSTPKWPHRKSHNNTGEALPIPGAGEPQENHCRSRLRLTRVLSSIGTVRARARRQVHPPELPCAPPALALSNTCLPLQIDNRLVLTYYSEHKRERVVILGSGWAGYAFARELDPKKYERILISPRSYFVFTPLLASTSVGTLEFRSVLEPVRRLSLDSFHQAWADDVDFSKKLIRIEKVTSEDATSRTLPAKAPHLPKGEIVDVPYDKLVLAVGAYSQTFGIEGVKEYANFLRDIGDARSIRLRVLQCFERADWPTTTDEQRRKLLHFAVVGGGPTGIEVGFACTTSWQ